ncbi:MAG: hypothetical protein ACD_58C00322G0010 [uncultured bacterium]|nr:MAG: hypothetical protein ACD_58C00322G0010 [uncultured bacterium]
MGFLKRLSKKRDDRIKLNRLYELASESPDNSEIHEGAIRSMGSIIRESAMNDPRSNRDFVNIAGNVALFTKIAIMTNLDYVKELIDKKTPLIITINDPDSPDGKYEVNGVIISYQTPKNPPESNQIPIPGFADYISLMLTKIKLETRRGEFEILYSWIEDIRSTESFPQLSKEWVKLG